MSLTIPLGMYGLLGPKGAGKSALMRILAKVQAPDAGSIHLGATDLLGRNEDIRSALAYLPQERGVYPQLSAENLLEYFAMLKGFPQRGGGRGAVVEALLRRTRLWESRKQKLGACPVGVRQRFGLAVALLCNPKLVIVDEPTAGLEPADGACFLNLLSSLAENCIVILSTSVVGDVGRLCKKMAIMDHGEILLEAAPGSAIANLRGRIWCRTVLRDALPALARRHLVLSTCPAGAGVVVRVISDSAPDAAFLAAEPTLDDVYAHVIAGRRAGRAGDGPV
ncbi:MAG: ATP-binding cassette domain-containing protein [Pseudomonadota bacterium]